MTTGKAGGMISPQRALLLALLAVYWFDARTRKRTRARARIFIYDSIAFELALSTSSIPSGPISIQDDFLKPS